MKDHEKAAADLAAMIDAAQLDSSAIAGGEGGNWSDAGVLEFRPLVTLPIPFVIRVSWSCGSAVPLIGEREPFPGAKTARTVDATEWRARVRLRFVPSTFDIVSSMLSDVASLAEYSDWLEAAEEFGFEMNAVALRKFRDGFERTRTEVVPFLRRAFGCRFDDALRLAGEL
jgi:hypothetical protein